MTLRHLKIFVAVCNCGSVTAAAQKLYLSQPAASLAISELERYYGICLFDRIGRRLQVTQTGRQFLQYAEHIVNLFDELEHSVRDWDAIGVLRVGASITIGNCLLPGCVKAFQKRYPQVQVRVQVANTGTIEHLVLDNQIDFGLVEGDTRNPYIACEPFCNDNLVLICSPQHPFAKAGEIDVAALTQEVFIMREKGSAGREIFDGILQLQGTQVTPAWESTSTQAVIRAVEAGLGLSVLPHLLVREKLACQALAQVSLRDVPLTRTFSVIRHKNKFLTPYAQAFIEDVKRPFTDFVCP